MKQKEKNKIRVSEGEMFTLPSRYPFHFCPFVVIPSSGFSNKLICWTEADGSSLVLLSRIFTDPKLKLFVLVLRMITEASNTSAYYTKAFLIGNSAKLGYFGPITQKNEKPII